MGYMRNEKLFKDKCVIQEDEYRLWHICTILYEELRTLGLIPTVWSRSQFPWILR